MRRGFCLRELATIIVAAGVAAALLAGMAPEPPGLTPRTATNLQHIAQAAGMYQQANNGYLPMTLTYTPRGSGPRPGNQMGGWCTWQWGGKNNNGWWATGFGSGLFDVEAADRPLNAYMLADEPFYAPPYPARLPANDPARTTAQAEMCRDPGDAATFQRNWPMATKTITGYDDVGTSYVTNMVWWEQIPAGLGFVARFNEGTRRIAVGQGANPSRFVWMSDHYGDLLSAIPTPNHRVRNGLGHVNFAPLLFVDGHATYEYIASTRRTTQTYTFLFE